MAMEGMPEPEGVRAPKKMQEALLDWQCETGRAGDRVLRPSSMDPEAGCWLFLCDLSCPLQQKMFRHVHDMPNKGRHHHANSESYATQVEGLDTVWFI